MYAEPGSIAPGGGASYFISGIGGNDGAAEPFTADGEWWASMEEVFHFE